MGVVCPQRLRGHLTHALMKRTANMITRLLDGLARLGLRFPDAADEQKFFADTFVANKAIVQIWLLVGGILYYVFFIWDQIIDPVSSSHTQMIRGLIVTPII